MNYERISLKEREEISLQLNMGLSIREVSRKLHRSASSISREIKKSGSTRENYRAIRSHGRSVKRSASRRGNKRKLFLNDSLQAEVHKKLGLQWSPEQIARYLKKTYEDSHMHISKESIYTYIYVLPRGGLRAELTKELRRQHKKRKTQGVSAKGQRSNLEDMLSIEERPKEVEARSVPGHWEGDIIIGDGRKQTALGTLVERTTRTVILVPLKNKTSDEVQKCFAREMKKLPTQMRLTLTYDQGREMAKHKLFTKKTKVKVYFAHPRSPWERGTNENTNGLIRQYFPKGTDFTQVSRYHIKKVQDRLNGRPRKVLNWETPYEAMAKVLL